MHSHDHSHGHNHGPDASEVLSPDPGHLHAEVRKPMTSQMRRLRWAMLITGVVLLVEVAGGIIANSLALMSDAGHMFTHLLALGISYFAIVLSMRPATQERTFGYFRAEVLVALLNGVGLFVIAGYIVYTAILRTITPEAVQWHYMLSVAVLGLIANGASVALLAGVSGSDLNLRAAFFHVLYDTISSVAVVAAAVVIWLTDFYVIDPLVSMGIALLIFVWAFNVIGESVHILLEGTPRHLDLAELRKEMEGIERVDHVHDLHVWQITTNMYVLTAHVLVGDIGIDETTHVIDDLNELLRDHYGIGHSTLQIEYGLEKHEYREHPREAEG